MSTPTPRPPESTSTLPETPAAIAREIAQLATAPVRDLVSCGELSDHSTAKETIQQEAAFLLGVRRQVDVDQMMV